MTDCTVCGKRLRKKLEDRKFVWYCMNCGFVAPISEEKVKEMGGIPRRSGKSSRLYDVFETAESGEPNHMFASHIKQRFGFNRLTSIAGFRSEYEFYQSDDQVFSFCNDILNIPTGIIDKEIIAQISRDLLGKSITHATLKKKLAATYMPEMVGSRIGYAFQNVLLFLAATDHGTARKHGHGLKFTVTKAYNPTNAKNHNEGSVGLRYIGSTTGYKNTSGFHLFESRSDYYLFSNSRLDLITAVIRKNDVKRIHRDYHAQDIDRVSTRIDESRKYFKNIAENKEFTLDEVDKKMCFKFQNAFYVLIILRQACACKVGRTMRFEVRDQE